MSVKLKQFIGSEISPKDDAIIYDLSIGQSGIISGCELTHLGANQVAIASGRGVIKGHGFVVEAQTILCEMSTSGTVPGRIYLHMDLSDSVTPIAFKTVASAVLPDLIKEEDCNETNGVYEIELTEHNASEVAISDLVTTFSIVKTVNKVMLSSMSEVMANTFEDRVVDAIVVKEVINSLNSLNITSVSYNATTKVLNLTIPVTT